jgi:hypothetical protein
MQRPTLDIAAPKIVKTFKWCQAKIWKYRTPTPKRHMPVAIRIQEQFFHASVPCTSLPRGMSFILYELQLTPRLRTTTVSERWHRWPSGFDAAGFQSSLKLVERPAGDDGGVIARVDYPVARRLSSEANRYSGRPDRLDPVGTHAVSVLPALSPKLGRGTRHQPLTFCRSSRGCACVVVP